MSRSVRRIFFSDVFWSWGGMCRFSFNTSRISKNDSFFRASQVFKEVLASLVIRRAESFQAVYTIPRHKSGCAPDKFWVESFKFCIACYDSAKLSEKWCDPLVLRLWRLSSLGSIGPFPLLGRFVIITIIPVIGAALRSVSGFPVSYRGICLGIESLVRYKREREGA